MRSWVDKARVQLSGKLARNASWSFFGQMVSIVLQAGYFVVIARLLGSTNYGIYTGAFALVSIVSQYSSLGSGFVFLRRVSADPGSFSKYWGNILINHSHFWQSSCGSAGAHWALCSSAVCTLRSYYLSPLAIPCASN